MCVGMHSPLPCSVWQRPDSRCGAVNVVSTFVAVIFVDVFGRKFLLIQGGVQMISAEIVVGVTLATQFSKFGSVLPHDVSIGVLVVICVFIAGFAWSWGPIGALPCTSNIADDRFSCMLVFSSW